MELVQVPRNATRAMPVPVSPYRQRPSVLLVLAAGALASAGTTSGAGEIVVTESMVERWTAAAIASTAPIPSAAAAPVAEGCADQGAQVMELRRRSGLTWSRLAELFGVERRSVHFWASGRAMNDLNRERLGRVLGIVRRLPTDAEAVRRWMFSPNEAGSMPFDQLREARFDEIVVPPPTPTIARPVVSPAVLAARAPRPPEELVDARHEQVHSEVGTVRPARSVKVRA